MTTIYHRGLECHLLADTYFIRGSSSQLRKPSDHEMPSGDNHFSCPWLSLSEVCIINYATVLQILHTEIFRCGFLSKDNGTTEIFITETLELSSMFLKLCIPIIQLF